MALVKAVHIGILRGELGVPQKIRGNASPQSAKYRACVPAPLVREGSSRDEDQTSLTDADMKNSELNSD